MEWDEEDNNNCGDDDDDDDDGNVCSSAIVGPKIGDLMEPSSLCVCCPLRSIRLTCKVVKINGRLFMIVNIMDTIKEKLCLCMIVWVCVLGISKL